MSIKASIEKALFNSGKIKALKANTVTLILEQFWKMAIHGEMTKNETISRRGKKVREKYCWDTVKRGKSFDYRKKKQPLKKYSFSSNLFSR